MTISTYSELQTAVNTWAVRSDSVTQVKEFIALGEARLNRLLGVVETDATLTGTASSRVISVSSLNMERPISLFIVVADDEYRVQLQADGTFPYVNDPGQPETAAFDGTNINFNRPLDQAYSFRLRYRGRFALSDASPTNWLLTNNPDLYLAATMMWGAGYREDMQMGMVWKTLLDEGIPEVRHQLTQSKRGSLRVDPAIVAAGGRYSIIGDD